MIYEPERKNPEDLPAGVDYLGVDAAEAQHFVTSAVGTTDVYVTDDGAFLHYELTEHDVADWVANVRSKRGSWQHLNYVQTEADESAKTEAV